MPQRCSSESREATPRSLSGRTSVDEPHTHGAAVAHALAGSQPTRNASNQTGLHFAEPIPRSFALVHAAPLPYSIFPFSLDHNHLLTTRKIFPSGIHSLLVDVAVVVAVVGITSRC